MSQQNRAEAVLRKAGSLIAASALTLSLTPAIALADNDAETQTPQVEQTADAANDIAADQEELGATDENETQAGVEEGEEAAESSNEAAVQEASQAAPLANAVAKIGDAEYATFDEAVAAAEDGATIELLADTTTAGMNLSKNLTIDGGTAKHTLTFDGKGIGLWGKALTFKSINVTMNGIGATPYPEWTWQAICASANSSLSLDNASLSMDGSGVANNTHAIYFCGNNKLNLDNASQLSIKNYPQDALEWDGGDGGYNVNIRGGSSYISDHNRSGFTGTFYATVDASTVKVLNSTGNGSNGSYFNIKNSSNVLFDGNGAWGCSAWRIDLAGNSNFTATNNAYSGIWARVLNADSSCTLDVENNGTKGNATHNAGIFFQGNGTYTSELAKGANVTIKNNAGCGIYTAQKVCNLTIGSATITNNGTGAVSASKTGAEYGGGIYNVGTLALDPSVEIYNNHASKAGDDLYSTEAAVMSFGETGNAWMLDDYNDAIDGWYADPEENAEQNQSRWNAHPAEGESAYVLTGTSGKTEGTVALKAAHGLTVAYQYVGEAPASADLPAAETGLQSTGYNAAVQGAVSGWTFDGWYTDEACTQKWVDGTDLTKSMTLYGAWTKNTEPVQPGTDESSEPSQPGSNQQPAEEQQASTTENLAKTGDANLLFGFAAAATALIAAGVAFASRKFQKR